MLGVPSETQRLLVIVKQFEERKRRERMANACVELVTLRGVWDC